jgi:hypothetical protein
VDNAFMKTRLMPNHLLFVLESSLVGFPDDLMEHEFLAQRLTPHERLRHIQHAAVADNTPENGSVEQQTTHPEHADPPESASQSLTSSLRHSSARCFFRLRTSSRARMIGSHF